MDNIKFQFDQVIGDCVKNVFLVEWKI
jgi:hypothetical protein